MCKKLIATVMVLCMIFTVMPTSISADAIDTDTKRIELQKKLNSYDKKLKELGSESKETEEYIAVLDKKLAALKEQYDLAEADFMTTNNRISELEQDIAKNEDVLLDLEREIPELERKIIKLNKSYTEIFEAYGQRMRAIYISGNQASTLGFILDADGISNLLTRYEMVRAVSKKDSELLHKVQDKSKKLSKATQKLKQKHIDMQDTQQELTADKSQLKVQQSDLLEKEETLEHQKNIIQEQQQEANKLLKNLTDKTKQYGEYRDITREELDAIDAVIAEADKKYQDPPTTTHKPTTKATTKSTTKPTTKITTKPTTKPTTNGTTKSTTKPTTSTTKATTKATTTKATTTKAPTSSYISLCYPVPAYKNINCGFGAYYGHTGCDFSTDQKINQKVVATESGTVIVSTDIKCNRSTCYKSNHGGGYCSYGRYIVIRHDKKTKTGQTVYTLYAHNNSRIVSEGQYVKKGEQIAWSGSTGNSTGPHCHFEVRVGGSSQNYAVNPVNYLPKK